jgi:hypothetical protein
MDPFSISDQTPIVPLCRRTMQEPRIPNERHRDRTAVAQVDGETVVSNSNLLCCRHAHYQVLTLSVNVATVGNRKNGDSSILIVNVVKDSIVANSDSPFRAVHKSCCAVRAGGSEREVIAVMIKAISEEWVLCKYRS